MPEPYNPLTTLPNIAYGAGANTPYLYPSTGQMASSPFFSDSFGRARPQQNPLWFGAPNGPANGGGAFNGSQSIGDIFAANGGSARSGGNVNSNISGGGDQTFSQTGQPSGDYNPYQFMPSFANYQRPDSPVAGPTPEEEYLRQYIMGQLLGPQQGQETSYNELLKTVGGDYLNPETNPYLNQSINALGADTTNQLNNTVNQILSRSGTSGALGGSRSALMQGQAGGESVRGFNEVVANLLNQNYQGERNRQLGSIPELLNVENLPIQQAGQAKQLASEPRQFQQQLINAQMGEWLRQQNERLLPLQTGQSVLGQRMGQTIPIVSPQQSTLAGLGQLGQGLGSLASGFGSMGNMFSGLGISNPAMSASGMGAGIDPFAGGFDPFAAIGGGASAAGGMGGIMDSIMGLFGGGTGLGSSILDAGGLLGMLL